MATRNDNGSLSRDRNEDVNNTESHDFSAWLSRARTMHFYSSLGFIFIGLTGNILCTKVMGKVQKTMKGVRLIRYLTIVDGLVLLLYGIAVAIDFAGVAYIFDCSAFIIIPTYGTIYMLETNLTVLIAVQRCLVLTIPFKYKRVMWNSLFNKIWTGIIVFTIIFNIPEWIDVRPIFYWNEDLNMTLIQPGFMFSKELIYYWTVVRMVFCHFIPVVILVVCNVVLIVLRRRMTIIGSTRGRRGANQLTAIVIAIIAMSVIVHSMSIALFVIAEFQDLYSIVEEFSSYRYVTTIFVLFFIRDLLICVNSSTNFIFYCSFGREFRRTLMEMFRRAAPTQQPQHHVIEMREVPRRI